jgi:hypothetical protein
MCPHIHFAMFKSRQLCFIKPCFLPSERWRSFLTRAQSTSHFRTTRGAAVPGPLGRNLRCYLPLVRTDASKPLTVVLMSPLIGRHKMRASWKGHVNLPITIRGPPCGPLKIPEVSVCCTPLQRLQRQLA